MLYYQIAIDVPLPQLFTYRSEIEIPLGSRVKVRFGSRGFVVGVVWQSIAVSHIDFDLAKIQPVIEVLDDGFIFDDNWRRYMNFASQYYHYPIGQTMATSLPKDLLQTKNFVLKAPIRHYALTDNGRDIVLPKQAVKQQALWEALLAGSLDDNHAKNIHTQAKTILNDWFNAGWVQILEQPKGRAIPSEHQLNDEQQLATDQIISALNSFQVFLLHGITGSGKTEVYFHAMAKALADGKQVLFLLPEINLTPQLLKRIDQRFEHVSMAVLHSQMANGERTQNYVKALLGQAQLILGTRLSVLTPLQNLGLIVVDEEHDGSFKQENELRYQARDLAVWRAKQAQCPIVLGSATPSLESWQKTKSHQYQLLRLTQRAHEHAVLPAVILDNIARQKTEHGFAALAIEALQKNYEQDGLSLVYLNRRGFAPVLMCADCGHSFACPFCSAKMVLHQRARHLRCHHCDHHHAIPNICPTCGNQDLTAIGHGTQRVEETLRQLLPQSNVVRVDRDSTSRKNDWEQLYSQIQNQEIDVLVGTQMLAKGHDFPNLNLVVVLDADGSLFSADFRAPERLFAELMQVSGRSGRADKVGKVIVQTKLPEHKVFQALVKHDYISFADAELAERELFAVPPFSFSIAIRADAYHLQEAMGLLKEAKSLVETNDEVSILGPAPMLMARLAKRERAQLFLESTNRQLLHRIAGQFAYLLNQLAHGKRDWRWSIDVDPQEF